MGSNEVVEVLVKYQPYPGLYMWHCHNAVHEDNGMMAIMNITRLADMGYSGFDLHLEDPLDVRFRPQPFQGTNLEDVKTALLPAFARLKAYPDPIKVRDLEDQYWAKKPLPDQTQSASNVPKNTDPEKQAMHESHHGSGGQMGQMNMNGKDMKPKDTPVSPCGSNPNARVCIDSKPGVSILKDHDRGKEPTMSDMSAMQGMSIG
jgi:Multicopper oxidase